MYRYPGLLALVCAIGSAVGQLTLTNTERPVLSVFAIDPTDLEVTAAPTIQASLYYVDESESETAYYVGCTIPIDNVSEEFGRPQSAPCNYLHGASITLNPSGMTMTIHRQSQILSVRDKPRFTNSVTQTRNGTATCVIQGSTSASCTGHVTSYPTTTRYVDATSITERTGSVSHETISTAFPDVERHYLPITITDGLEELPTPTTSLTSTTGSTGAAAMVTAMGQAAVVGVAALAGGAALL
ncbi:hypothetical protein C7999DRAFT_18480 [Corynascus novoguineensis]|uniref:Uncharacterized protein n=1 Tax=Corynascus novoguineensis TaxID=1126955 RepID=A0AAN7HI81_9PEZI|nr:hypothetical protein C7999DRAFT_18480 [Corynascus novoguineensis]